MQRCASPEESWVSCLTDHIACGLYHTKFGVIRPPELWGDGKSVKKRRPGQRASAAGLQAEGEEGEKRKRRKRSGKRETEEEVISDTDDIKVLIDEDVEAEKGNGMADIFQV